MILTFCIIILIIVVLTKACFIIIGGECKDTIKERILYYFISFIFVLFIFASAWLDEWINDSKWNNGKCPNCNIQWQLIDCDTDFNYYICEKCGKQIDIER